MFIGIWAFILAVIWCTKIEGRSGERVPLSQIWERFPKFVLGYLFWGEMPAPTVYVGAFLVVAAGLTLALSERRSRREIAEVP